MKAKEPTEIEREEIYQARLKKFELFKKRIQKVNGSGFRRIEVEIYLIKDYIVLNR
jgi:hypothetical protein